MAGEVKTYDEQYREFEAKQNDMLSGIPGEFKGALSYLAWQQGHAYGFNEVLSILDDLVDAMDEPIKKFAARLKGENDG